MRILIENLEPYRKYALQVRGSGEIDTEWSPTYILQTERDRIAPPQIPVLSIDGSEGLDNVFYWYGQDLVVSWGNYGVSDQSTWDHSHYAIEFVTHDDRVAKFITNDQKFILTYSLNVQKFGSPGVPSFKRVSVWGIDRTGNPSYGGQPWFDGPDSSLTKVVTQYPSVTNPAPTALANVFSNFETRDLIFTWDLPATIVNKDVARIKIALTGNGQTKVFYASPNINTWTFSLEDNIYHFNKTPSLSYSISVLDVFEQESAAVNGTAINLPPDVPVGDFTAMGIQGGITAKFRAVNKNTYPAYKDHQYIQLYEKVCGNGIVDADIDSLDGYRPLAVSTGTEYSFIPDDPSFAERWIRGCYVDWYDQSGPITKADPTYPVKMKSAVSIQAYAPPAPTNLAIVESETGDALGNGEVYLTWTPPEGLSGEVLTGYYLQYSKVSVATNAVPSWVSVKVNANRVYVTEVNAAIKKVSFSVKHNFQVGDRVSIVNYGANMQHRFVTAVEGFAIYLDDVVEETLLDNSLDRAQPGTAVVTSSATINLKPGTRYKLRIASESTTFTSEFSDDTEILTSGNALIAKKPLEVGTYYDPINITGYSISGYTAIVETTQNVYDMGIGYGTYVSIADSHPDINGRWKVTGAGTTGYSIVFSVDTVESANFTDTTGTATAGTFAIGAKVTGVDSNDGLYMNESNLWLSDSGAFRAGNAYGTDAWTGVAWEPNESNFKVSGDINTRSGYFSGNVFLTNSGSLVVGKSYIIDSSIPVTVIGDLVTIPLDTEDNLDFELTDMVQVLCSNIELDTGGGTSGGTPIPIIAYDNIYKTITVSKPGVTGGLTNGTIMVNAVTALGEKGLVSTDDQGKIKFMLTQSGLNRIGGWDITTSAIKSSSSTPAELRAGMSADASLDSFWAGGDSGSAVFRVNEEGNMNLGDITFQGTSVPSKIYSGLVGEWGGDFVHGGIVSNTPPSFYIDSSGKFSIGSGFTVDVDPAIPSTTVRVGSLSSEQFVFDASSYPKFFQGAGQFGNQNTNIYLDHSGNFSISNFFRLTTNSAIFDLGFGDLAIGTQFTTGGTGLALRPDGNYLVPSNSNSLIISRDSGQSPNSYEAGVFFPSWSPSRTYISSNPQGNQLFINISNGTAQTGSMYMTSANQLVLASTNTFTAQSANAATVISTSGRASLESTNADVLVHGASALTIQSPAYTNVVGNGGVGLSAGGGSSISIYSTGHTYVTPDLNLYMWADNYAQLFAGLNVEVKGNTGVYLTHGFNSAISMRPTAGDLNVVLDSLPWFNAGDYYLSISNAGIIRRHGAVSSRELKRDIADVPRCIKDKYIDDLLNLNLVSFKWKIPDNALEEDMKAYDREQLGYIVEDAYEAGAEWAIFYDDDEKPKGFTYNKLTVVAIEAIKKQQEEIDNLMENVIQLQNAIQNL